MSPEDRSRLRKQMSEQAVKLAVSSRWDEAASLNREFVRLFPDDAEGYNRLGKSLTELGHVSEARQCYGKALEVDPANQIARRNLDRLASMKDAAGASLPSQLDTRMFIEETGKASVTTLQAIDPAQAATLDAGDLVELRLQGNAVNVHSKAGGYVGMVEPRVGLRLAKMMEGGNLYSAALVSVAGNEIRVIIRETYQHPSLIGRVSFPQARAVATNDALVALVGGCGELNGVMVISGTGSIAYGFTPDGRSARAGGYGQWLGDEGSGFTIAHRGLIAVMRAADGREPPTAIRERVLSQLSIA
ncbi:tetratricopeptide repeat protein, partial [bacterium]